MRIGELEQHSGASRHTLRYYESVGLISAQRQGNNYRDYSAQTVKDLSFIQQAQGMGFSLAEIGEILQAQRNQQLDCAQGALLVFCLIVAVYAWAMHRLDQLHAGPG